MIADSSAVTFIMPLWSDPQYDEEIYQISEAWARSVQDYATNLGKGHSLEFANYAAPFQDPMASYGPENLGFLKGVSQKYDPDQLFQRAVLGGYKLGSL